MFIITFLIKKDCNLYSISHGITLPCHIKRLCVLYRFIRVVGTHNTVNKVFHLVALECMYTQRAFILENGLLGNVVDIHMLYCSICAVAW